MRINAIDGLVANSRPVCMVLSPGITLSGAFFLGGWGLLGLRRKRRTPAIKDSTGQPFRAVLLPTNILRIAPGGAILMEERGGGVRRLFRECLRDAEAGKYLDCCPIRLKLCQRRVELLQDDFVGLPGSEGCPDDP